MFVCHRGNLGEVNSGGWKGVRTSFYMGGHPVAIPVCKTSVTRSSTCSDYGTIDERGCRGTLWRETRTVHVLSYVEKPATELARINGDRHSATFVTARSDLTEKSTGFKGANAVAISQPLCIRYT